MRGCKGIFQRQINSKFGLKEAIWATMSVLNTQQRPPNYDGQCGLNNELHAEISPTETSHNSIYFSKDSVGILTSIIKMQTKRVNT